MGSLSGMDFKPIRDEADLQAARVEMHRLMNNNPEPGSREHEMLGVWAILTGHYLASQADPKSTDPITLIRNAMAERSIPPRLLSAITRLPEEELSAILRKDIPLQTSHIEALCPALDLPLEALLKAHADSVAKR
ncbi:Hypothetical protein GbCGDNIH9_0306 [Granulibacter bethesdensis]|uniref:Uncharacterized protein n=2 Tax=Granulibacter bethesdensis TaxID=364410 RepID=A0AAC9KAJ7_9PROT|nr:Hypothetical protein GbCGDNIH9_0306 [Granulibacter bethesdensis]APH61111.1 Hypothetical protein GbCGDNIH8_0306 [Granulibacter bethesdensis]